MASVSWHSRRHQHKNEIKKKNELLLTKISPSTGEITIQFSTDATVREDDCKYLGYTSLA